MPSKPTPGAPRLRFGPIELEARLAGAWLDRLLDEADHKSPSGRILSWSDVSARFGSRLVAADEVPARWSDFGQTYGDAERFVESRCHSELRSLVTLCALQSGLSVYPHGVGAAGVYTLADLLVVSGDEMVFVECVTAASMSESLVARKRQLCRLAPLIFVLGADAKTQVAGLDPETAFFGLLHRGEIVPVDGYAGETCSRCASPCGRGDLQTFTLDHADIPGGLTAVAEGVGRVRFVTCRRCEPSVRQEADALRLARAARRESERKRDFVASQFARGWFRFPGWVLEHAQHAHAEELPLALRKVRAPSPEMIEAMLWDLVDWYFNRPPTRWTVIRDEDHSDREGTDRAGEAHWRLDDSAVTVRFNHYDRDCHTCSDWGGCSAPEAHNYFDVQFAISADGGKVDGASFIPARCEHCGERGCTRCIEGGPFYSPSVELRPLVDSALRTRVQWEDVRRVNVPGVGRTSLRRIVELKLSASDVLDEGRWTSRTRSVSRLAQRTMEVRDQIRPRLLARVQAAATPPSVTNEDIWRMREARGRSVPIEHLGLCAQCRTGLLRGVEISRLVAEELARALAK